MLTETQIRKKCERGESHGPCWYLYFRRNGKLTSRYIGKTIPDREARLGWRLSKEGIFCDLDAYPLHSLLTCTKNGSECMRLLASLFTTARCCGQAHHRDEFQSALRSGRLGFIHVPGYEFPRRPLSGSSLNRGNGAAPSSRRRLWKKP